MALSWLGVDLRTGQVLADLPDLTSEGFTRTIGQYDSTTASLPINGDPAPPVNWIRATQPYWSMLVAVDSTNKPRWAGICVKRKRAGDGRAELTLATPESYTERRFIRDTLQYKQIDRLVIGADLLNRYVIDGAGGRPGVPWHVRTLGSGELADGDYKDSDDHSIYSILQDLGMEWTVDLAFETRAGLGTCIVGTFLLAERLGQAAPDGSQPAVTLDWPGNLASVTVVESYANGSGANDDMATSTGQGDVRPQSDHQTSVPRGMPVVERRFSPGSNIVSKATLNAAAKADLVSLRYGSTSYSISISQSQTVSKSDPTPLGFAISLGDDIGLDISGPDFPDHPRGVRRAVSMKYDTSTVTPVLANPDGEGDDG